VDFKLSNEPGLEFHCHPCDSVTVRKGIRQNVCMPYVSVKSHRSSSPTVHTGTSGLR